MKSLLGNNKKSEEEQQLILTPYLLVKTPQRDKKPQLSTKQRLVEVNMTTNMTRNTLTTMTITSMTITTMTTIMIRS
jgi:hypothetical protein